PHRHVYGEQWIKFMKDGVNASPLPTDNTTGYIDHAAFLGTINPDTPHADGWFIVFDTLTFADDRLEAFYDNPNALRDYFRDIGRMVLAAEGRKANDSHADCYQYFCVPEYCTANGRLHFHAVH